MAPAGLPRCYVASPYGFAESTRGWYDEVLLPRLARHVHVLDPWVVDVALGIDPATATPEVWVALGQHHLRTIREEAELVVACLDQEPPDVGTTVELATAAALGIPVIGYRGDVRTSGERGLRFNLMLHAAIRASGGVEAATLDELDAAVARFAGRLRA